MTDDELTFVQQADLELFLYGSVFITHDNQGNPVILKHSDYDIVLRRR